MRQVVGFGDWCTGRGTFGGEFGARHCNQWGLYGVRVRQRRDAALFPNYFEQTCYNKGISFNGYAARPCSESLNHLQPALVMLNTFLLLQSYILTFQMRMPPPIRPRV